MQSFVTSPSWTDAKARFDRLSAMANTLKASEVEQIVTGFRENDQLHNSIYLTNKGSRLIKFLKVATRKDYLIEGAELLEVTPRKSNEFDLDDDIPF